MSKDHDNSVFLAGAMNWTLETSGNPIHDTQKRIFLCWGGDKEKDIDPHMIGFLKTVPIGCGVDPIFFPDLFDKRNSYFIIWAIQWGYDELPGFKKWIDEPGIARLTLLTSFGLKDAMNKLVAEVQKHADP